MGSTGVYQYHKVFPQQNLLFCRTFELAYGEGEYLSAVRSIRGLRPLRAINRVPSKLLDVIV